VTLAGPQTRARPRWVFAYGSLMWNPGFAVRETASARLQGWHRALCIYSEHYRGTPEKPGLILGLLPGGACRGLAHRLPIDDYDAVRRYLLEREIHNDGVYRETVHAIRLADGRVVAALVYLADRNHRQFAGKLVHAKALALVREARGATGSNLAYVQNTVAHLRELGLNDRALEALAREASASVSAAPRRRRRSPASGNAAPRGPARP
jgi:cation transport protein ChaC